MKRSPLTYALLFLSVPSLILGPMIIVLFLAEPGRAGLGLGMTLFGAIGLWIGMKGLAQGRPRA